MKEKASNGMKKYKHIFFDVDGTLTRSRSPMKKTMERILRSLIKSGRDVIAVSGADLTQMRKQVGGLNLYWKHNVYFLAQNGNYAQDKSTRVLWSNILSPESKSDINNHINTIRVNLTNIFESADESDLIQDRGSQISLSLLGHHAELERKEGFDPDGSRRREILQRFPLISDRVEVRIGGTTCLDYFEKGKNKGFNVKQMIEEMKWNPGDCVYVGDALFEGGNDETVKGIIDTHPVKSPEDTVSFIKNQMVQSQEHGH